MKEINFIKNIFDKRPKTLIFFITNACNHRCKHCFYWKKLGKKDELSLGEIKNIIEKLPKTIFDVALSGGELFLRKDLSEIVNLLSKKGIKNIGIPTNGLLTEHIVRTTEEMIKSNPQVSFTLVVSLDGMRKTHEYIRGVKGGFDKAVSTIKGISKLRKKYKNLTLSIGTTVMNYNVREMKDLSDFVKTLDVDLQTFDLIRGEHQKIFSMPSLNEVRELGKLRIQIAKYYNSKNRKKNKLHQIYSIMKAKELIKNQERVLKGRKWSYKCMAGISDFVIHSNGDFALCELLQPVGNIKHKSFDELIKSEKAKAQLKMIKKHKCDCTHICFLGSSLDRSFAGNIKMIARNLF